MFVAVGVKTAPYGRLIFGASAVLFGVICLMWHDADTWQEVHSILRLPLGTIVGSVLMLAQIAGGILLIIPRTVRVASIVLSIVYALFSLASIPGIIAAPKVFGEYDGFFEQFCLLCGALAAYAATQKNTPRAEDLRRFARIGLGLCAISFTLAQAVYLGQTAALVPAWIPPSGMFWAILTTIAFALAAIAILINRYARLAMRLMGLMIVLFGVLVWVPHVVSSPGVHGVWSEFAINFLIAGATWVIADF